MATDTLPGHFHWGLDRSVCRNNRDKIINWDLEDNERHNQAMRNLKGYILATIDGNLDEAEHQFQEALQQDENCVVSLANMACLYELRANVHGRKYAKKAQELLQSDRGQDLAYEVEFQRAYSLCRLGPQCLVQAVDVLQQLWDRNPVDLDVLLELVLVRVRQLHNLNEWKLEKGTTGYIKHVEEIDKLCHHLYKLGPQNAHVWTRLIHVHLEANRSADGKRWIHQFVNENSHFDIYKCIEKAKVLAATRYEVDDVYICSLRYYKIIGDPSQTEELINDYFLHQTPGNPIFLNLAGSYWTSRARQLQFRENKADEAQQLRQDAIDKLKQVFGKSSHDHFIVSTIAQLYTEMGDINEGGVWYSRALDMARDKGGADIANILFSKLLALITIRQLDEAIVCLKECSTQGTTKLAAFSQLVRKQENLASFYPLDVHFGLTVAYMKMYSNDVEGAEKALSKSRAKTPSDIRVTLAYIDLCLKQQQPVKVEDWLKKAEAQILALPNSDI